MASSSGNSSKTQSSGSEEDLQILMDQRKNKRKQSNRESARRSRMRKQNHLEDLTNQVSKLTKDNGEILTNINITTQHYLNVEAENSILRAQMGELNQRLQSLNDILNFIKTNTGHLSVVNYLCLGESEKTRKEKVSIVLVVDLLN
ncbi:Basic-leucine zipper domain [Sesbania bispinosa]|nr:Basic-leucine zipper domain [Sesbania bispinosa]